MSVGYVNTPRGRHTTSGQAPWFAGSFIDGSWAASDARCRDQVHCKAIAAPSDYIAVSIDRTRPVGIHPARMHRTRCGVVRAVSLVAMCMSGQIYTLMRTNIVIDDKLMRDALHAYGTQDQARGRGEGAADSAPPEKAGRAPAVPRQAPLARQPGCDAE